MMLAERVKMFLALHQQQCCALPQQQQQRCTAGTHPARMTLASVTSPLSPKCSRSRTSSTYAGRFLTHRRELTASSRCSSSIAAWCATCTCLQASKCGAAVRLAACYVSRGVENMSASSLSFCKLKMCMSEPALSRACRLQSGHLRAHRVHQEFRLHWYRKTL